MVFGFKNSSISKENFKCVSYWDFAEHSILLLSSQFVVLPGHVVGEDIYCKGVQLSL